MKKFLIPGSLFVGLTLFSGLAGAASVTGSYGLTGYLTVGASTIDFGFNQANPNSQTAAVTSASGSFTLSNTAATVNDLVQGTGPGQVNPGGSFNYLFIVDNADGIDVNLTSLPIPSYGVCNGTTDTVACRPNAASPILLTQFTAGGVTSTFAELNGAGDAFYATSPGTTSMVNIGLSATFNGSIDDVLKQFATNGNSIGTVYSDKLLVTAVPEPGALAFLGLGLVSLGAWKKRRAAK